MKEPKKHKFEENKGEKDKFAFFKDGLFPEDNEIRNNKNKSSHKENNRIPFSLPNDINKKKTLKTQNDDEDLLPYFAKDYPSSSESKEEICFINSPIPSESSMPGGEAEEVEGVEEEGHTEKNQISKKLKKEKNEKIIKKENDKQKVMGNDESGMSELSVDYNSELEAEQEKQSSIFTRKVVVEMFNAQQEKNKEEERKKEEEEKKKKDEEEKRKKKEEEEKIRKEKVEMRRKFMEQNRKNIIEAEKRRQREEEKLKKKIEIEKIKKEEELMKKRIKSVKKNEPFNVLSSIKKNYDDIGSTSLINEVNQIFPGAIPEENSESEQDDDNSKKNFKNASKGKYKKEPQPQEDKTQDSKSKKVSNFNDKLRKSDKIEKNSKNKTTQFEEDDKKLDKKEKNIQKSKKKTSQSKKSNGLKKGEDKEKKSVKKSKKQLDDNSEEEDYSNYGDDLQSSDSDKPKKQKLKIKEVKRGKPQKKISENDKFKSTDLVALYRSMDNVKLYYYDAYKEKEKEKTFGNGRYSLRNRLKRLRPEIGEKAFYVDYGNGPELQSIRISSNPFLGSSYIYNQSRKEIIWEENRQKNRKKKKLLKGKGIYNDNSSENEEFDSDNLDSQNFSEFGEDDARFLKIPKNSKKNPAKNYDTLLIIKVHQAEGKNKIKVDKKEYKDLKSGDVVKVNKNQVYEIINFSDNDLIVQLLLDYNEK